MNSTRSTVCLSARVTSCVRAGRMRFSARPGRPAYAAELTSRTVLGDIGVAQRHAPGCHLCRCSRNRRYPPSRCWRPGRWRAPARVDLPGVQLLPRETTARCRSRQQGGLIVFRSFRSCAEPGLIGPPPFGAMTRTSISAVPVPKDARMAGAYAVSRLVPNMARIAGVTTTTSDDCQIGEVGPEHEELASGEAGRLSEAHMVGHTPPRARADLLTDPGRGLVTQAGLLHGARRSHCRLLPSTARCRTARPRRPDDHDHAAPRPGAGRLGRGIAAGGLDRRRRPRLPIGPTCTGLSGSPANTLRVARRVWVSRCRRRG